LPELQNNNLLVKELAKSRLDIINYIQQTSGFSQIEIDTILAYASIVNDTELIFWALDQGGQLYMFALIYAFIRGNSEIQNYIINLDRAKIAPAPPSHYIDAVINGGAGVYDSRVYRSYPDIMSKPLNPAQAHELAFYIKTVTPYVRWVTGQR
jgi:hypothetical protein